MCPGFPGKPGHFRDDIRGALEGHLEPLLGHLGPQMGYLGLHLGLLGGSKWVILGPWFGAREQDAYASCFGQGIWSLSWAILGLKLAILGSKWAILGSKWAVLRAENISKVFQNRLDRSRKPLLHQEIRIIGYLRTLCRQ